MRNSKPRILDEFVLPHGLEIDLDEGWRKLISRQFGGGEGRGFCELIQNFLDSYPSNTPWAERRAVILTNVSEILIRDFGEGMHRGRLKLAVTLGGTDKWDDESKIGKFGMGLFSMFNPKLGTEMLIINTNCEGEHIELVYTVVEPEKRPTISARILDTDPPFSTQIRVVFDNDSAPRKCLEYGERSLRYYPCSVTINGRPNRSVWEEAREKNAHMFEEGSCDGFVTGDGWGGEITLLCKYEHIMRTWIGHLITGGHGTTLDLRDYRKKSFPFVPGLSVTVNCSNLSVTISRDQFYLDSAYHSMVAVLRKQMHELLGKTLSESGDKDVVLGNQYILANDLRTYIHSPDRKGKTPQSPEEEVIGKLAAAKVYTLNGRRNRFSVIDIKEMRSDGLPIFYSPQQTNLRWLGGAFKHDFVVLPPPCHLHGGAPNLYDTLFADLFGDVINLDTIKGDTEKIKGLVERGIVDKDALSPKCRIAGQRGLSEPEARMLGEIDSILAHGDVRDAVAKHVQLPVDSIRTVLFDVEGTNGTIATGVFDESGSPLNETSYSNFEQDEATDADQSPAAGKPRTILLGLHRKHPLIGHLMESDDPHRAYYTLTFLAHELALCQKMLVPYSPFYHLVKERLAADMRRAMMNHLLVSGDV